jgi:phosphonate transport system ATP-binding protein
MKKFKSIDPIEYYPSAPFNDRQPILHCAQLVSKARTGTARPILDGIDCTIAAGDFVALVGLNGAGKSSLLRAIAGLLPLKRGSIRWRQPQPRMSMVFQGGGLIPQLSAIDNVLCGNLGKYSLWQMFRSWPKDDRRAGIDLLDRFNLAGYADRQVAYLSGGQQQRVAIARALWQSPDLLLADEPTTGLDILAAREAMETLARLHQEGMTIITVLHDLHLASAYARTAIVMDEGRVIYQGEAGNLVELFPRLIKDK